MPMPPRPPLCAIDEPPLKPHHSRMAIPCPTLHHGCPLVVGSAASADVLQSATVQGLESACDLVEVRLDLLDPSKIRPWQHLASLPLLFTARRGDEGGSGDLDADERSNMLLSVLDKASLIDLEVASIDEMDKLIAELNDRDLPWIASFHDFEKLPEVAVMKKAAAKALAAGAQVFKFAANLADEEDLARLIEFQTADHGLPTATMGMGELGAQSRVQLAKAGSVLNYGYLGASPTAPGQMSAGELKQAIRKLGSL